MCESRSVWGTDIMQMGQCEAQILCKCVKGGSVCGTDIMQIYERGSV
jgi:hypothetical protein